MNKKNVEEKPLSEEEVIRSEWKFAPLDYIAGLLGKNPLSVANTVKRMNRTAALRCLERKQIRGTKNPRKINGWQRRQMKVLRQRTSLLGGGE